MDKLKRKIIGLWEEQCDQKLTAIDLCVDVEHANACGGISCDDCPLGSAAYLVAAIKKELGTSD